MNHFWNQNLKTSKRQRVVLTMVIVITLALILQMGIMSTLNKRSSSRTTALLLNQVVDILRKNRDSISEYVEILKHDYIFKSKAVSYILHTNPKAENDIKELSKIAGLVGVDEINFFDKNGKIYFGTQPEYYGYDFNSGEQISFFRPMLNNKDLSMCQDITPNTVSNKTMMYAITWDEYKDRMIQVGIEPVRLMEQMKKNELQRVIKDMTTYEGVLIFVADLNTGIISGASDSSIIGMKYDKIGYAKTNQRLDFTGEKVEVLHINGFRHFCRFRQLDNLLVAVDFSTKQNLESFIYTILVIFIYLLIAALFIYYRVRKEEKLLMESNTDELTGLLNRRAYEYAISAHNDTITENDFVYVSIDVNCLKTINDTIGHTAGDELICGAAECLRKSFASYGRIYRIGGDEFAAMIFVDKERLKEIRCDFKRICSAWHGKLVSSLSMSVGFVAKADVETSSVREIASLAEKKMYDDKTTFYKISGIDRRQN